MPLHDFLQGDSLLFTAADPFQRAFGRIQVLDILQVSEGWLHGHSRVLVRPVRRASFSRRFFDGLRKSNGQHNYSLYTYSIFVLREARRTLRTAHPITSTFIRRGLE